ncbi:MAG: hypothetical protein R3202_11085, partial [Candidatus Competibacterales bacterium]|nr:hypothetical protein [Candidatus Competibacterales bacterium]
MATATSWRRIAYRFGLGTAALLLLALTWLWTADLGVFKPQIERFLTGQVGREFRIEGNLSIHLGLRTTLVAEGVRVANPAGVEGGDMVTVGRTEIHLDLGSLFGGPPVIDLFALQDAAIHLGGTGDPDPTEVLAVEPDADRKSDAVHSGMPVLVRRVEVDRVDVRLEGVKSGRPRELAIERLAQRHGEDDFLHLELRGTLDGRPITLDGQFGDWQRLRTGRDLAFQFDAAVDSLGLSGHGRIDDVMNPHRPEVRFVARGPDIDVLTGLLSPGEESHEGDAGIDLAGSLTPAREGQIALELKGHIGETEIHAGGILADLRRLDGVELRATAAGPDLGRMLRLAGIHQVGATPFSLEVDARNRDGGLTVDRAHLVVAGAELQGTARLPNFPGIEDAVIRLAVAGPDIEPFRALAAMPGAATGPFSAGLTVDLHEEGFQVLELDVATSLAELRAEGRVVDAETLAGSQVEFRLQGESLARIARAYRLPELPDDRFEVTGAVEYTGDGIRTLGPLRADLQDVSARVDGRVALNDGLRGTDLTFVLAGGDFAGLVGGVADSAGIPALAYDVRGRMQVQEDGLWFREVTGSLGRSAIRAQGVVV